MKKLIYDNVKPMALEHNQIAYLIKGGELLKQFFGYEDPENRYSQIWLASTVTLGIGKGRDGLSVIRDCGYLKDLLDEQPERYMGEQHVKKYGSSPGILVKVLNSGMRLLVQAHPSEEKAKKYFNSPFGKTEAWYILDTEEDQPAYIYAGFLPGVNREKFKKLIQIQDTEKILCCLHRFKIKKGDMIYIPAGMPHALGEGSLVLEIQEPSDITLRAEQVRPDGSELPKEAYYSGLTLEDMLDCFDFTCRSRKETWDRIVVFPELVRMETEGEENCLIGRNTTRRFAMNRIIIFTGERYQKELSEFCILFVVRGLGKLYVGSECYELKKGSEYFLPYQMGKFSYAAEEELEILECYPPEK